VIPIGRFCIFGRYRFAPQQALIQIPENVDERVLYGLCAPDFPWQPDPLREHPQERAVLFELYEQLLRTQNLPFTILSGSPEKRFAHILQIIQRITVP
jgi:nicotinamide riboside kinase